MPTLKNHPALAGRPVSVWHPDLVGIIPFYPKTEETFLRKHATRLDNARKARQAGKLTRKGSANGWRGRQEEMQAQRRADHQRARLMVGRQLGVLTADGEWPSAPPANASGEEISNWQGAIALAELLAITLSDTYAATERLMAARVFLTFTTPKPIARKSITFGDDGLEWLRAQVAAQES